MIGSQVLTKKKTLAIIDQNNEKQQNKKSKFNTSIYYTYEFNFWIGIQQSGCYFSPIIYSICSTWVNNQMLQNMNWTRKAKGNSIENYDTNFAKFSCRPILNCLKKIIIIFFCDLDRKCMNILGIQKLFFFSYSNEYYGKRPILNNCKQKLLISLANMQCLS